MATELRAQVSKPVDEERDAIERESHPTARERVLEGEEWMPDQDGFYHLTIRASCGVGSSRSSILPIDVEYDVSEFVEIHCGVCGCDLRVTYEGKPWTPMQLFLPFPVPRSVTATKDEPEPGDVPAKAVKKARSRKRNRSGPA